MSAMKKEASELAGTGPAGPPETQAAFATFFAHRPMLRAYLFAMTHDRSLVDDLLSDVAIEVARTWAAYDQARPFGPWARGVARRLALKALSRRGRWELGLPEGVLETLGVAMDELCDGVDMAAQQRQLQRCLERLNPRARELMQLRYFEEQPLEAIASRVARTMGALYTAYSRIHDALLRCMQLAEEPAP
jgi:RNA polymerase sigma-70 factor (ECF subfamily)